MPTNRGRILLVNPWIYDFAAYNLWIEPIGLLTIAAVLGECGYEVSILDCMAPHAGRPPARPNGAGRFTKTMVDKPEVVRFVPRRYGRYGLPLGLFEDLLGSVPTPDLILVASGMTYWYEGVLEAIRGLRSRCGGVPLGLGGVYATLCPVHARRESGADLVIRGPGVVAALAFADQVTGNHSSPERYTDPNMWPAPAHELVPRDFAAVSTSWGCPYRCSYCASHLLQPAFVHRAPAKVLSEIMGCVERGIRDFAFYDDALLLDAGRFLVPLLEDIVARNLAIRLHTPNGLHARGMTGELAHLLRRAGLATVRLSLETADPARQQATGGKVITKQFVEAARHLRAVGYGAAELGAYIMAGLPGQPLAEVEETIRLVHDLGVQAKLALFSPIPGTADGDRALPAHADPLLHNNTVYPYLQGEDHVAELQRIKQLAKDGNRALVNGVHGRD